MEGADMHPAKAEKKKERKTKERDGVINLCQHVCVLNIQDGNPLLSKPKVLIIKQLYLSKLNNEGRNMYKG